MNAPLAPMQCHAGRSPLGRTGITDDDVCWSALRTSPVTSTPSRSSSASRLAAIGSSPTAPKLCTSAPSRLRMTAVPPAVPAGEKRIVSTSWPSEPSGIDSMPMTWVSRTCTPTVAIFMVLLVDEGGGSVAAGERLVDDVGLLLVGEHARRAEGAGPVVERGQPLQQQRVLDGLVERAADGDRPVVGHQRGLPAVERVADVGGELGRAEGGVRRDPDRPAEQELLVVQDRQLVEHAGDGGREGRVGVHDGGGAGGGVHGEVQVELGGGHAACPRRPRRRASTTVTSSAVHSPSTTPCR